MPLSRPLLADLLGDEEVEALLSDQAQLTGLLAFEHGLAAAEAELGLIPEAAASAIATAINGFQPDWVELARGLVRDGVVVPALLTQLRALIGTPHAASLHYGATSQDAIDTALVLQLARVVPLFLARLEALETTLQELADDAGGKPLMAHTRMQAAQLFTVADKLRTWREPLERRRQALATIRQPLLVVQLGGPVGNRAGFDGRGEAVARGLARRLDLGLAEPWHSTRDPLIDFASQLSLVTGSLGKLGADVTLLAQPERGAVVLANAGGSSSMPHKANPVDAELLVTLARYNAGLLGTMHQALVHENERSGAAWSLEWMVLPQMLIATGASLRLAQRLAQSISF